MITHLSLFPDIGGLELAAESAGFKTVGQSQMCEDFVCTNQEYGYCNYDDAECEGGKCQFHNKCEHCIYGWNCCQPQFPQSSPDEIFRMA